MVYYGTFFSVQPHRTPNDSSASLNSFDVISDDELSPYIAFTSFFSLSNVYCNCFQDGEA